MEFLCIAIICQYVSKSSKVLDSWYFYWILISWVKISTILTFFNLQEEGVDLFIMIEEVYPGHLSLIILSLRIPVFDVCSIKT